MSHRPPHHPMRVDTVEKLSWLKGEPSWMTERRLEAWKAYARQPLQDPQHHFDSLEAFLEPPRHSVPAHQWPPDLQHTLDERGDEEGLIIQRDSTILSRAVTKEAAKKGVIFTDLDTAVKSVPELVKRFFGAQVGLDNAQAALNTAFWSGGTFLYVPAHVEIDLAFHTCYWMSTQNAGIFPRTVIVAESGSAVSFIDEYISGATPGLSIAVTEIVAREQSRVRYCNLQNWSQQVHHGICHAADTAASATLQRLWAELGAGTPSPSVHLQQTQGGKQQTFEASAGPIDTSACSVQEAKGLSPEEARYQVAREYFEPVLQQVAHEGLREKVRHYVVGKVTGFRPTITLQRAAELYPERRV